MDERTLEILKRFAASWDETKAFYDDLIAQGWDQLNALKEFINTLEQSGGRQFYRLGTSIYILIISRSVDKGLRPDQKSIRIDTLAADDFEVTLHDADKIYRQYRVKNLRDPRVEKLLKTLKTVLID
jgi:hypothetical protein